MAPPGFAYLGHSLRSGGSSAAEAISVPRYRGNWLGGWAASSRTREVHYMDPSVLPTPAAFALFGWLRAGAYAAEAPVWEPRPSPSRSPEERIVSVTLCVTTVEMVCWMLPPEVKHVCLRAAAGVG